MRDSMSLEHSATASRLLSVKCEYAYRTQEMNLSNGRHSARHFSRRSFLNPRITVYTFSLLLGACGSHLQAAEELLGISRMISPGLGMISLAPRISAPRFLLSALFGGHLICRSTSWRIAFIGFPPGHQSRCHGKDGAKSIPFKGGFSCALESFDRPARGRYVDLGSRFESQGTRVYALLCCQRSSVQMIAGIYGATAKGGAFFSFVASYSEFIDGVVPHEREFGEIDLYTRYLHQ